MSVAHVLDALSGLCAAVCNGSRYGILKHAARSSSSALIWGLDRTTQDTLKCHGRCVRDALAATYLTKYVAAQQVYKAEVEVI